MKNKILVFLIVIIPLLDVAFVQKVNASAIYNNNAYINYYSQDLETRLDDLVVSGIISQAQATIVLDIYYDYEITTKRDMKDQLDILVADKTITQGQEYFILSLFIDLNSNYKNNYENLLLSKLTSHY